MTLTHHFPVPKPIKSSFFLSFHPPKCLNHLQEIPLQHGGREVFSHRRSSPPPSPVVHHLPPRPHGAPLLAVAQPGDWANVELPFSQPKDLRIQRPKQRRDNPGGGQTHVVWEGRASTVGPARRTRSWKGLFASAPRGAPPRRPVFDGLRWPEG